MKKSTLLLVTFFFPLFFCEAQVFTDVYGASGLVNTDKIGSIREVLDYNNDGWEDLLCLTDTSKTLLYRNNGIGTFSNVTAAVNLPAMRTNWTGIISVDLDNDGFRDLIFTYLHGGVAANDTVRMFRNVQGSFVEKTTDWGLAMPFVHGSNHWSNGLVPFDYDRDGDLDLLFASSQVTSSSTCTNSKVSVLINNLNVPGAASFNTVVDLWTYPNNVQASALNIIDVDNDQFPDIVTCEQNGASGAFGVYRADPFVLRKNNQNGTFSVVAGSGLANAALHGFITVWDYNNDGYLDMLNGTSDCCGTLRNILWRNNGNNTFTDVSATYNLHPINLYYGRFAAIDFNNDGFFDVSTTNIASSYKDNRNQLWQFDGTAFTNTAAAQGIQLGVGSNMVAGANNAEWFDFDNDGDLDMFNSHWGNPGVRQLYLMKNPYGSSTNYLKIKLKGFDSPKDGTGSRVVVKAGGKVLTQYSNGLIGNSLSDVYHFGMGSNAMADSVIVYWSSGKVTKSANVSANQMLVMREGTLISTPALTIQRTLEFDLPVVSTQIDSAKNVLSYQFDVDYDAGKLSYLSASVAGTLASSGTVLVNNLTLGHLTVGFSSATPIKGAGDILRLRFRANAIGTATPTFSNFRYNTTALNEFTIGSLMIVDTIPPRVAVTYSETNLSRRTGDLLTLTATFSEAVSDDIIPRIALSGANTLVPTNMVKTTSSVYTYAYSVKNGSGAVLVSFTNAKDLAGNAVVSTPLSGGTFSVIPLRDGDVDDDGNIYAYDAALVLQYLVNISPIVCPLPWQPWRLLTADVDSSAGITPMDASLILKRAINLITSFPVGLRSTNTSDLDVLITTSDSKIIFTSQGELFGIRASIPKGYQILGKPVVLDKNMLTAFNIDAENYKIGLAMAYAPAEGTVIMEIPYQSALETEVTFDLVVNKNLVTKTVKLPASPTPIGETSVAQIQIYTNDAHTILFVRGAAPEAIITVFDLSGKCLLERPNSNGQLTIGNLKPGIYMVQIRDWSALTTKKIVL